MSDHSEHFVEGPVKVLEEVRATGDGRVRRATSTFAEKLARCRCPQVHGGRPHGMKHLADCPTRAGVKLPAFWKKSTG